MGGTELKPPPSTSTPSPPTPPLLQRPWRVINWGAKKKIDLLSAVRNYKPEGAKHLRILLYGAVGAGKSSFINYVRSVIEGKFCCSAAVTADIKVKSNTLQYNTHTCRGPEKQRVPIVFNNIMGLEAGDSVGVRPEDIKLAMEGHMRDGYMFNAACALSPKDTHYYNPEPTLDDKVHVLVCILNANVPEMNASVLQKMRKVREAARDLGIPQVAFATHIDQNCTEIEKDVKNVFKSTVLKNKLNQFSTAVGFPTNCLFPVWNNCEGENKEDAETLMLDALKNVLNCGDNFIDNFND